jgi:hypothetical protein
MSMIRRLTYLSLIPYVFVVIPNTVAFTMPYHLASSRVIISLESICYNVTMREKIKSGDCVKIPDGRIARVRDNFKGIYRVRVRRETSQTHQFLEFNQNDLSKVDCPPGWMSPEGYNRYMKITLHKMQFRKQKPDL